jgi:hypothetical protein
MEKGAEAKNWRWRQKIGGGSRTAVEAENGWLMQGTSDGGRKWVAEAGNGQ